MLPTLSFGWFELHTYGLMWGLAVVAAGMYSFHRLVQGGSVPDEVVNGLGLALLAGLAGMLLLQSLALLLQTALVDGAPQWIGRSSSVGAVLAGVGAGAWYTRRANARRGGAGVPLSRVLDLAALPLPLLWAIGRLGCIGAGCCAGSPTAGWLGFYLPDNHGDWQMRYPTQALSLLANLGIFLLLLAVERRGRGRLPAGETWPFNGFLFLLWIELFSLERFVQEFLRQDALPLLGPLSLVHLVSAGMALAAAGLLLAGALLGRGRAALALSSGD